MADALVSIQVLPRTQDGGDVIPLVDQAIALIDRSGVTYRVGPLETTMEGNLDELLEIVAAVNKEMIKAGCPSVISQVKIYHAPSGASMAKLTQKYD